MMSANARKGYPKADKVGGRGYILREGIGQTNPKIVRTFYMEAPSEEREGRGGVPAVTVTVFFSAVEENDALENYLAPPTPL